MELVLNKVIDVGHDILHYALLLLEQIIRHSLSSFFFCAHADSGYLFVSSKRKPAAISPASLDGEEKNKAWKKRLGRESGS